MRPETEQLEPQDWPGKASATLVDVVGSVRSKTTGPALMASRYLVYFLAISLILMFALVLILILAVRVAVTASGELSFVEENEAWFGYYVLAGIFLLIGMILWRKKES